MTLDMAGNAYIGGYGLVAKLSADTGAAMWSINLGPANVLAVAVDASGAAYATGDTRDPAFATTPGAFQPTYAGPANDLFGFGDAFVAKINPSGDGIAFSTYLGGSGGDRSNAIAVDSSGSVWVAGFSSSADFPTTSDAVQPRYAVDTNRPYDGHGNAFLVRLNSTGTILLYGTFLGGTAGEEAQALSIDAMGSIEVGGYSRSQDFPLLAPVQALCRHANCGFLSKIGPRGLVYSTYIGGRDVAGLVRDPSGDIWLVGSGSSLDNQIETGGTPPLPNIYGGYLARVSSEPPPQPRIWDVRDGATYSSSSVAPGEIIAIYGEALGPEQPVGPSIGQDGTVSTSAGGIRVLVDGTPVPLLYASVGYATAVMPFGVSIGEMARVEVEHNGVRSSPAQVWVSATAPQVLYTRPWWNLATRAPAVLNQNGSINSWLNPASRGSVVTFYLTGAGAMSPQPRDGEVLADVSAVPTAPLNVTIDFLPAQVLYVGNAPGLIAGVIQVNVVLPQDARAGPNIQAVITFGAGGIVPSIAVQ